MQSNVVNISAVPEPFKTARVSHVAAHGLRLSEMLEQTGIDMTKGQPRVFINGERIPELLWQSIKPKPNALVEVKVVPLGGGGGGKNPLRTILSIAVIAVGSFLTAGLGTSLALGIFGGGVATAGQVAFAGALIKGVVGIAGTLLVNAIAPPPSPRLNSNTGRVGPSTKDSPTLFIEGARNQLRTFAPVPVGLGYHKFVPPLGAKNFTESEGDKQYVRQIFNWGYGPYDLDHLRATMKIGDTSIDEFEDVEIETVYTEGFAPTFTLYSNSVDQTDLQVLLDAASGYQTRTTGVEVDEILVDITFANGLVRYDDQGKKRNYSVNLVAEYSPTGAGTWTEFGNKTFTRATTAAIRETFRVAVPNGQYDVRIKRVTADTNSTQIFDKAYWTALRTVTLEQPIDEPNVVATAIRMRATDQLNGVVDTLSAELRRICLDWDADTTTWVSRTTRNPASLFRWVLQGAGIYEALIDSRLNMAVLQEWHEFCEDNEYYFNGVIDYESTVYEVLRDIASAGRASPALVDGKWSVVIDKEQTIPAANFTPHNSWGYQGTRLYPELPHAFRCQFLNEEKDFRQDELIVYDDGYDENSATVYETLELFGITNPEQVYKHGREHIASVRLRPEIHSFNVDIENLVATRGDLITFTHDIPLFGISAGRIKSITTSGDNATHVTLTDDCPMELGKNYSLRFRLNDGTNIIKSVVTQTTSPLTLQFTTPFDISGGDSIEEGNLFMFGETGSESVELVIQSIEPGPDFTALLKCVDAAPGIFTASSGSIPTFNSNITSPIEFSRPAAPIINEIQTGEEVMIRNLDGSITTRMVITLTNPNAGDVTPVVKIRQASETSFRTADTVFADPDKLVLEGLDDGERYDIKVYYKRQGASLGSVLSPAASRNNVLFEGASARPDDVQDFRLSVVNGAALLSWRNVSNLDFEKYEIRFSPELEGVVWGGAQVLFPDVRENRIITPLQIGTYLIKALDRGGLYSENATSIATSIDSIDGLNFVELIEEDPSFSGYQNNVTIDTDQLVLDDISLGTGIYKFNNSIDLGAAFTSKITPNVVARGKNEGNTLDIWGNLNTVTSLSGTVTPDDWNSVVQIRTTQKDPSYTHPTDNIFVSPYAFENADGWNDIRGVATNNVTHGPDGTLTAAEFVEDSDTGGHYFYEDVSGLDGTLSYSLSVYIQPVDRDFFTLRLYDLSDSSIQISADFDLDALTATQASTGSNATFTSATIQDAGNGWYRLNLIGIIDSTGGAGTDMRAVIYTTETLGSLNYTGDGTSKFYIWGAELVQDTEMYDPEWSAWEDLVIGDYNFWSAEFRIVLTSETLNITPAISRLEINIDMPDRIYAENDLVISTSGETITYDPAFKAKPKVVITAQSLSTGDYWEITNQSVDGFDVIFKDSGGSPVERTMDYVATGYGRKQT